MLSQVLEVLRKTERAIRRTYSSGRSRREVYGTVLREIEDLRRSAEEGGVQDVDEALSHVRDLVSDLSESPSLESAEFVKHERELCSRFGIREKDLLSLIRLVRAGSGDQADVKLVDHVPRDAKELLLVVESAVKRARADIDAAMLLPRKPKKHAKSTSIERFSLQVLGYTVALVNVLGAFGFAAAYGGDLGKNVAGVAEKSTLYGIGAVALARRS